MLDFGIDFGRILSNRPNPLVAHPILTTCTVTDAPTYSIHVQTIGLVIFGRNQLCSFLVDGADMWKYHNVGNLIVGAGRGASKECHCPIYEHGMV